MKPTIIVLPHQLFEKHPLIKKGFTVYLVEDTRFFTDFNFHVQKLILHRATMKMYQTYLQNQGMHVEYVEYKDAHTLFKLLCDKGIETVDMLNPCDHAVEKRFKTEAKKQSISLTIHYDTPYFVTPSKELAHYFEGKKKYLHAAFYMWQRKRMNILLNTDGSPAGEKWSFDTENRERISINIAIPKIYTPRENDFVKEARTYVKKQFPENPGDIDIFLYPTTFETAHKAYDNFLDKRFSNFGTYQDAILADEPFLFHAVISPLLNCGLLTPKYVIEKALTYAKKEKLPLNTIEGFIRQIIGWREFVWGVYYYAYNKKITANYFDCTQKIPYSWWTGETALEPVNIVIKRVLKNAYAHHIERLMIIGNAMLLHEFHPKAVYVWFMELFIDSYDWVMVPNIYGMSQFADGGLMTTKPYISASAYIKRQSNFKKGPWCDIWDTLFWHFLHKYRMKLIHIPRMALLLKKKTT